MGARADKVDPVVFKLVDQQKIPTNVAFPVIGCYRLSNSA